MPLSTDLVTQQLITVDIIQYIQEVIKNTSTPSWVNTVPKNYGEASAGTIKADEWRILFQLPSLLSGALKTDIAQARITTISKFLTTLWHFFKL